MNILDFDILEQIVQQDKPRKILNYEQDNNYKIETNSKSNYRIHQVFTKMNNTIFKSNSINKIYLYGLIYQTFLLMCEGQNTFDKIEIANAIYHIQKNLIGTILKNRLQTHLIYAMQQTIFLEQNSYQTPAEIIEDLGIECDILGISQTHLEWDKLMFQNNLIQMAITQKSRALDIYVTLIKKTGNLQEQLIIFLMESNQFFQNLLLIHENITFEEIEMPSSIQSSIDGDFLERLSEFIDIITFKYDINIYQKLENGQFWFGNETTSKIEKDIICPVTSYRDNYIFYLMQEFQTLCSQILQFTNFLMFHIECGTTILPKPKIQIILNTVFSVLERLFWVYTHEVNNILTHLNKVISLIKRYNSFKSTVQIQIFIERIRRLQDIKFKDFILDNQEIVTQQSYLYDDLEAPNVPLQIHQLVLKTGYPKQVVVESNNYYDHIIEAWSSNTLIHIAFVTKHYDIGVQLHYLGSFKNESEEYDVIFDYQNVQSSDIAHRATYKIDKCGLYRIRFDNTYSWITSKELVYRIYLLQNNDSPNEHVYKFWNYDTSVIERFSSIIYSRSAQQTQTVTSQKSQQYKVLVNLTYRKLSIMYKTDNKALENSSQINIIPGIKFDGIQFEKNNIKQKINDFFSSFNDQKTKMEFRIVYVYEDQFLSQFLENLENFKDQKNAFFIEKKIDLQDCQLQLMKNTNKGLKIIYVKLHSQHIHVCLDNLDNNLANMVNYNCNNVKSFLKLYKENEKQSQEQYTILICLLLNIIIQHDTIDKILIQKSSCHSLKYIDSDFCEKINNSLQQLQEEREILKKIIRINIELFELDWMAQIDEIIEQNFKD